MIIIFRSKMYILSLPTLNHNCLETAKCELENVTGFTCVLLVVNLVRFVFKMNGTSFLVAETPLTAFGLFAKKFLFF